MDLYRLSPSTSVRDLVGSDIFTRPGVRLVEWSERLDESDDFMGCQTPNWDQGRVDLEIRMSENVEAKTAPTGAAGSDAAVIDLSNFDVDGDACRTVKVTTVDNGAMETFMRGVKEFY